MVIKNDNHTNKEMNVAIVGAGNGGKKVMQLFLTMKNVNVVSVVDRNLECEGIKFAKSNGISCVDDISKINGNVQVIIEATGNASVYSALVQQFANRAQIVGSTIAELLMQIIDNQVQTADKLNTQMKSVQENSLLLQSEVESILEITNRLSEINTALLASSDESKHFISQSDDMIKAVNKLTQQIKILGLNANIEAARAGEHGRGFSVVATEVQKMSDSTNHFANQIGALLRSLNIENEKITQEVTQLNDIAKIQNAITERTKRIADELNQLKA